MDTKALLKKVRYIELKTKGVSNQIFSGEYHSAFKGKGMVFSQVREYVHGDEVKTIDWNVTARYGDAHVKEFEEEREMNVLLLVDISASQNFGTTDVLKNELVTELSAVLGFSATKNNDKIGLLLFSDCVELYVPPKKGKKHILRIIRELIEFKPTGFKTNLELPLNFVMNMLKKRSLVFLISDFLQPTFPRSMSFVAKKHDLIAIKIADRREFELPNMGLVRFYDPEQQTYKWVQTARKKNRINYTKKAELSLENWQNQMKRYNIAHQTFFTDESYVFPLMKLLHQRWKTIISYRLFYV